MQILIRAHQYTLCPDDPGRRTAPGHKAWRIIPGLTVLAAVVVSLGPVVAETVLSA